MTLTGRGLANSDVMFGDVPCIAENANDSHVECRYTKTDTKSCGGKWKAGNSELDRKCKVERSADSQHRAQNESGVNCRYTERR